MDKNAFENAVSISASQCIEICTKNDLVNRADEFIDTLQIKVGHGKGSVGGIRNRKPVVTIGSKYGRHYNKNQWLNYLLSVAEHQKQKVWKMAVAHARKDQWLHVEYSHIHFQPGIGGFVSDEPMDHVNAIVAHEISHAIQHWNGKKDVSHGPDWRYLYRTLRAELKVPALYQP